LWGVRINKQRWCGMVKSLPLTLPQVLAWNENRIRFYLFLCPF
jgi:hypothetical protein